MSKQAAGTDTFVIWEISQFTVSENQKREVTSETVVRKMSFYEIIKLGL